MAEGDKTKTFCNGTSPAYLIWPDGPYTFLSQLRRSVVESEPEP